ncbi:hypothetical protein CB1_000293005 [Camelus ferus]|nr:hypothetical protein CB1_000293005 [Camelus ferus]
MTFCLDVQRKETIFTIFPVPALPTGEDLHKRREMVPAGLPLSATVLFVVVGLMSQEGLPSSHTFWNDACWGPQCGENQKAAGRYESPRRLLLEGQRGLCGAGTGPPRPLRSKPVVDVQRLSIAPAWRWDQAQCHEVACRGAERSPSPEDDSTSYSWKDEKGVLASK